MKLIQDFPFLVNGDVFILRIHNSSATIWQRRSDGNHLLFRIPPPFSDAFGCIQEWELKPATGQQILRLDFLFRIAQPPSTGFEGVAYHCNMRSALSGGLDGSVNRNLQRYYVVDHIFTDDEARSILNNLQYYEQPHHPDYHWTQFLNQTENRDGPVARIEVAELIDTLDHYPASTLSDSALRQLQEIRYRRNHSRSGKSFLSK